MTSLSRVAAPEGNLQAAPEQLDNAGTGCCKRMAEITAELRKVKMEN